MFAVTVAQSVLDPAGPSAARITHLWWLMLWISTAVFAAVIVFLAGAVIRRGSRPIEERVLGGAVVSAVAVTVGILFVWLVISVQAGRATVPNRLTNAVTINVIGHRWWWEIEYQDLNAPDRRFRTANEIHIPVGRPVVLNVTSRDVVHSFWVPNLQGKRDLVPGYTTSISLQADQSGVYRGQCAEFCGYQHAHMAFYVTAESDEALEGWLAAERQDAVEPANGLERRGQDVFMRASCATCHTIRGTTAAGMVGPELTHVATRGTLAAGTLSNTVDHLAGWVGDPQSIKPGVKMPPSSIQGEDLQALVAYLEALK